MDYSEKCKQPIPIGIQRYAYQCENIVIEPIHGAMSMRAYVPHGKGKEPYPNPEADKIEYYQLEIRRFTGNAIELLLTKKFKDKSEEVYLTNVSFSDLVNRLFTNNPANVWTNESPFTHFERVGENN